MDVVFASLDHIVKHSMSLMGELINALQSQHIIKQFTISRKELFSYLILNEIIVNIYLIY
jgi:hypothetical protein